MPSKKYHEKLTENIAALKAGKEPPHEGKAAEEAVQQKRDLDNAERRAQIMNPAGSDVELSFGSIKLFPMTIDVQIDANAFCKSVLADAMGEGARNISEMALRVPSVVLRRRVELLSFVAYCSEPPGAMTSPKQIAPTIEKLREKAINADDYLALWREINDRSTVKPDPKA